MRARRFVGETLLEAVRRVKATLGPDALVVAVRPLSQGGWIRRRRPAGFELTALEPREPEASPLAADSVLAELRRLSERVESLAVALEQSGGGTRESTRALPAAIRRPSRVGARG